MDAVNVKINGLVFDHANYDADGDVLYLARGDVAEASDAALTPEGHGIRYDSEGHVIGVTIINARWLLDRDGHVTITLPQEVQVAAAISTPHSPESGPLPSDHSLPNSRSGPAVKGSPSGPSEASREAAPLTAGERRLPVVD